MHKKFTSQQGKEQSEEVSQKRTTTTKIDAKSHLDPVHGRTHKEEGEKMEPLDC